MSEVVGRKCPECGKMLRNSWTFDAKGKQVAAVLCINYGGRCDYKEIPVSESKSKFVDDEVMRRHAERCIGVAGSLTFGPTPEYVIHLLDRLKELDTIRGILISLLPTEICPECEGKGCTLGCPGDRGNPECRGCFGTGRRSVIRGMTTAQAMELLHSEHHEIKKERDHWKANHDAMVARNAILRQRPDLPVDRIPAEQEAVRLRELLVETKKAVGWVAAFCDVSGAKLNPDDMLARILVRILTQASGHLLELHGRLVAVTGVAPS